MSFGPDFAPPAAAIRNGFARVMAGVGYLPTAVRAELLAELIEMMTIGDPRAEQELFHKHLAPVAWTWSAVEDWRWRFQSAARFPQSWDVFNRAKGLEAEIAEATTFDSLLDLVPIKSCRLWLAEQGRPKIAGRTKAEFYPRFKAAVTYREFAPWAKAHLHERLVGWRADVESARRILLWQTVITAIYVAAQADRRTTGRMPQLVIMGEDRHLWPLIEMQQVWDAATRPSLWRFVVGRRDDLNLPMPPYFPGDRTTVIF